MRTLAARLIDAAAWYATRFCSLSVSHPRLWRAVQIAGLVDATRRAVNARTPYSITLWSFWVMACVWGLWITARMRDEEHARAIASHDQHSRIVERKLVAALKVSFEASRRARLNERAAQEAEGRAQRAYQSALDQQFAIERAEEWEAIAKQNASEGAKLAHVLIEHIAKLGDGTEVAKAHEALHAFERSQN